MFCTPGLVFGGTEGVGSLFHVLRARTHFRRYRRARVPFSCFARPDSFSAVPSASGPVFTFSAPGHVFGVAEDVRSRFHILHAQIRFRLYQWHRVPFSSFARPDSFSAVPRASGPVFMFYVSGPVFGGTECVGSRILFLRSRTHFRLYRGRQLPFSSFMLPDSSSAVPRASGTVFTICAPRLVFGGAEDVGSHFYVWLIRNHFRRYQGHRVSYSCFAGPDSFSAVPRASHPVFMFPVPRLVFGGAECVRYRFHVLRA
jgi:hypothetical protein